MKAFAAVLAYSFSLGPLTSLHSSSLESFASPFFPHLDDGAFRCNVNGMQPFDLSTSLQGRQRPLEAQGLRNIVMQQSAANRGTKVTRQPSRIDSVYKSEATRFGSDTFVPSDVRWKAIDWYSSLADICDKKANRRDALVRELFQHNALQSAGIHLPSSHKAQPSSDKAQDTNPWLSMHVLNAPRTQGLAIVLLAREDNTAFVSIRGSVCLRNFLQAAKCWPRYDELSGVTFHAGFHAVAEELRREVEELIDPGTHVVLTGHSMGGAVAAILALQLQAKGRDIAQVVSFGSPKHVWAAPASATAHPFPPIVRVEHPLDPIPAFPSVPDLIFGCSADSLLQPPPQPLPGATPPFDRVPFLYASHSHCSTALPPSLASHRAPSQHDRAAHPNARAGSVTKPTDTTANLKPRRRSGLWNRGCFVHLGRRVGLRDGGRTLALTKRAKGLIKGLVEGVEAHRLRSYRTECSSMSGTAW